MATQRQVELLFRVADQASGELKAIKKELQSLQGLQGAYQKTRQQVATAGYEGQESAKAWSLGLSSVGKAAGLVGLAYNNIRQSIMDVTSAGRGLFDLLVGQNEQLNLLVNSSAASIATSSKILQNGIEIENPAEAIAALQPRIRETLQQIQKDSIALVGVTSSELNGIFGILSNNLSKLSNQSATLKDPLEAAGQLTIDFAAGLQGAGIPLFQAAQELNSIFSGQISSDSALAAKLEIKSETIARWREQGVLVDRLREKLAGFVASNELNSRSITAVAANLTDAGMVIARQAGEPLLDPIVDVLKQIEGFVLANTERFTQFARVLVDQVVVAFGNIRDTLTPIVQVGTQITGDVLAGVENLVPVLGEVSNVLVQETLVPAGELAAQLLGFLKTITQGFEDLTTILANSLNIELDNSEKAVTRITQYLTNSIPGMALSLADIAAIVGQIAKIADDPRIEKLVQVAQFLNKFVPGAGLGELSKLLGDGAAASQAQNFEQLSDNTQDLIDGSKEYADELLSLNAIANETGKLTSDQIDQRKALIEASADSVAGIEDQIKALQGMDTSTLTEQEKEALGQQIDTLTQVRDLLSGVDSTSVTIANRDLQEYASTAELERKKFEDLQRVLNEGATAQEFDEKVKNFISSSQSLVASGRVSAEEAQQALLRISQDARVGLEDRQKAEQTLTQILQSESKVRQDAIANEISDVRELAETGEISRIEAEKRVTALTKEQIGLRLQALQAEIARRQAAGEDGSALESLRVQEAALINEQENLEIESAKRVAQLSIEEGEKKTQALALELKRQESLLLRGEITRSEFEQRSTQNAIAQTQSRIAAISEALETAQGSERRKLLQQREELSLELQTLAIEGARREQEARLKELEQSQDAALDAVRLAESTRITELERLRLREPELAARIEREIAQVRQDGIQQQLAAEQQRLAFLEGQAELTGEAEIERQSRIRDSRQRLADLTGQLVQAESNAQRALSAEINAEVDRRTQAITNALQQQTLAYERQLELARLTTQAEGQRLELLNAQKNLLSSRAALEQTVFQIAIAAADSEQQKARLQEKAGQAKLASKIRELQVDAQIFEIQEVQRKIELESEKIQSRIAQIKSRAALAEAQATAAKTLADPSATREQKAAALLGVKAAEFGVVGADATAELTDFKVQTNDALSGLRRETFQNQQQNELLNAQFEAANAIADPGRKNRTLDSLSRSAQQMTGVDANPYVTVIGDPKKGQASGVLDGITAGFDQLFGGLSEKLDGALDSFKVSFEGVNLDPGALGATQSTTVSQVINNIASVNFTNRIEKDSDRAILDGVRQAIADDLSNLFTRAAQA